MSTLIISPSITPIVRAGRSNMALPIFAIIIYIFINSMALPSAARLAVGTFLLLTMLVGLRMYMTTLARVEFLTDHIEILLAAYKREIRYDMIEVAEIVCLRLTPLLRIRIKENSAHRFTQFIVPGPLTPWGSLQECGRRLREEFHARGVRVIES